MLIVMVEDCDDRYFIFDIHCSFLREVASESEFNKMDCKNLGVVFSPTTLRPRNQDLTNPAKVMAEVAQCQKVVVHLLSMPVSARALRATTLIRSAGGAASTSAYAIAATAARHMSDSAVMAGGDTSAASAASVAWGVVGHMSEGSIEANLLRGRWTHRSVCYSVCRQPRRVVIKYSSYLELCMLTRFPNSICSFCACFFFLLHLKTDRLSSSSSSFGFRDAQPGKYEHSNTREGA